MSSDYYVSSVAYTAVAQWAATHTYAVGNVVRQLAAPAVNSERCFRVSAITTGISGGVEPTWNLGSGATTTDGGVTWTECTGRAGFQQQGGITNTWTAPAARLGCIDNNSLGIIANGDRVFASSDHAQTQASSLTLNIPVNTTSIITSVISVNRTTGNIPPLPADITPGASFASTGAARVFGWGGGLCYYEGCTFTVGTGSSSGNCSFQFATASGLGRFYLKNCALVMADSGAGITAVWLSVNDSILTWYNTTWQAGNAANLLFPGQATCKFYWFATPSAIQGATLPTTLIQPRHATNYLGAGEIVLNGVDLSALTTGHNIVDMNTFGGSGVGITVKIANCKLGSGVSITNSTTPNFGAYVEAINCDSANTNYNNYWQDYGGITTVDTSVTRVGGATDGSTAASRKFVSNANSTFVNPHVHHIWQWNTVTGVSKTATVEFISSATLNNDDIWGEVEYLGDSGDCLSLFANCGKATVLTTSAAQTSSSATWNNSPATPQKQKLAITFTAQKAGLLHFMVKLTKASTTVWVDPLITVT